MPRLTTIVAVGPLRARALRCVDGLLAQSAADDVEVIVVDIAPEGAPPLEVDQSRVQVIRRPGGGWGETRTIGVRRAAGEFVAFIEDHCVPDREWAAALLRAYEQPWDAVGYAFTNANPGSYFSEAALITDYGRWADPAIGGAAKYLPSNNVSYRRETLQGLEDELGTVYSLDVNLHEELHRRRLALAIEPGAVVAHENFERPLDLMRANHDFCRLMAANRVDAGGWGLPRRALYGAAAPVAAPTLKLARLVASLPGRGLWGAFARSSPVIVLAFVWAGFGEGIGYLTGRGSDGAMGHWEVGAPRTTE
jgi:hypothetical protein